jgi:hypothetical protein
MPRTYDHILSLDAYDGSLDSRICYVCFIPGLVHVRDRKLDSFYVASQVSWMKRMCRDQNHQFRIPADRVLRAWKKRHLEGLLNL